MYVFKFGVKNEVFIKKLIVKVNKKLKFVNLYEKRKNKIIGRDIKFIFVCVFFDGIMYFFVYVCFVILW